MTDEKKAKWVHVGSTAMARAHGDGFIEVKSPLAEEKDLNENGYQVLLDVQAVDMLHVLSQSGEKT